MAAVAESCFLALLFWKKFWKTLPIFTLYIAWDLASDLSYYLISNNFHGAIYTAYVVESTIDSLLQYCVLVELIWAVLRPVRESLPRASFGFLLGIIALTGLIIWPLAGQTVPPDLLPESKMAFHLEQTFSILRVIVFLVMASYSQILSIGWRDRELQVATGLGFYSIVSLIVAVVHTHQVVGLQYHWLDQVVSASYLGTLTYWVLSFAAKDRKREKISNQMRETLVLIGGNVRAERIGLNELPNEHQKKRKR
jgi:hypothetical protein